MIAERPLCGWGWNEPLEWAREYFLPDSIDDPNILRVNDFFLLGMTLGVPAMLLFVTYLAQQFRPGVKAISQRTDRRRVNSSEDRTFMLPLDERSLAEAGVIVLLVGFWFDGGLFHPALATPFWTLLGVVSGVSEAVRAVRTDS
jgi:hypothetical protein